MLLVLFVPFRYSFSGGINDPEGDTKAFHLDPKKDISAEGSVRWLLGALNVTGAVGGEEGSGAGRVEVRIFGRKYPIEKLLKKKEELREEEKEEKPEEPEEKKTLEEKIEAALQRVERLTRRIDDALRALQTEYGVRAKEVIVMRILHMIEQVMPTQWGLTGVLGKCSVEGSDVVEATVAGDVNDVSVRGAEQSFGVVDANQREVLIGSKSVIALEYADDMVL
jgi:hypothetical protein